MNIYPDILCTRCVACLFYLDSILTSCLNNLRLTNQRTTVKIWTELIQGKNGEESAGMSVRRDASMIGGHPKAPRWALSWLIPVKKHCGPDIVRILISEYSPLSLPDFQVWNMIHSPLFQKVCLMFTCLVTGEKAEPSVIGLVSLTSSLSRAAIIMLFLPSMTRPARKVWAFFCQHTNYPN